MALTGSLSMTGFGGYLLSALDDLFKMIVGQRRLL